MFRMDDDDDLAGGQQAARESSLTRGYEAFRGSRNTHTHISPVTRPLQRLGTATDHLSS